jgi:hypothetical protein
MTILEVLFDIKHTFPVHFVLHDYIFGELFLKDYEDNHKNKNVKARRIWTVLEPMKYDRQPLVCYIYIHVINRSVYTLRTSNKESKRFVFKRHRTHNKIEQDCCGFGI